MVLHTSRGMSLNYSKYNCTIYNDSSLIFCNAAITIGFTEVDYVTSEEGGQAKVILTVADSPINLTIPLIIMSFEEFFNNSNRKLPQAINFDNRDPAECKKLKKDFNVLIFNITTS